MNNNLGMQPNDFNNQNGAMQNQANNMQIVELIAPVAMEVGTQFSIREGGRTVAKGVVTEVLE